MLVIGRNDGHDGFRRSPVMKYAARNNTGKEKNLKDLMRKVGLIRWLGQYTGYTKSTNIVTIQNYLKQGSASTSFFPKTALQ